MTKTQQELFNYLVDNGMSVLNVRKCNIKIDDADYLDYVMPMEHWKTRKGSISLIVGVTPDDSNAIYWNSADCLSRKEREIFDAHCKAILKYVR